MNKSFAYVSCSTIQDVDWQPWIACPFNAGLAIFRYRMDEGDVASEHFYDLLHADERSRAERFRQKEDRLRFLYGRLSLRMIAARYLRRPVAEIVVVEGINKKPELGGAENVYVNLSHAGDWVLIAIGTSSLGVDIEKISVDFPFEDLLDQSFGPAEQQFIQQSVDSRNAFYRLWTRKEALVKATAKGMDEDFPAIPCLDGYHQVASSLIDGIGAWQTDSFGVSDDYIAAISWQIPCEIPKFYTIERGFFEEYQSKK